MVQCPHPCSPYSQGGAARRLTGRCPLLCSCAGCPAGDLGYLVTLVSDACATYSQQRHEASLAAVAGYCRSAQPQSCWKSCSRRRGGGRQRQSSRLSQGRRCNPGLKPVAKCLPASLRV